MSDVAEASWIDALSRTPVEPDQALRLMQVLAVEPDGVSLPRLCKRLGWRMSVLLRLLAWLGEDPMATGPGVGWVQVTDEGVRQRARLTRVGLEVAAAMASRS